MTFFVSFALTLNVLEYFIFGNQSCCVKQDELQTCMFINNNRKMDEIIQKMKGNTKQC